MKIKSIISVIIAVFIGLLIGVFSKENSKTSLQKSKVLPNYHGARSVSDSEYLYVSYERANQESEIIIYAMEDKLTIISRISYKGKLASLYQQGRYLFVIYKMKEDAKLLVLDIMHREKPVEKCSFDLMGQVAFQEEKAGTLHIFTQIVKRKQKVQNNFQYSLNEKHPDKIKRQKVAYKVLKNKIYNYNQKIFPFDRDRNLLVKINRKKYDTATVTLEMLEESTNKILFKKQLACSLGSVKKGQYDEQSYLQDMVVDHQRKYIGLAVLCKDNKKIKYHLYQYDDINGFQLIKEIEVEAQEAFLKSNGTIGGMMGKMHGNTLYVLGSDGSCARAIQVVY